MINPRPVITIRYATPADNERLTQFRIDQFKTSKQFKLKNPAFLAQQRGHVYIIIKEGDIISTMQVERLSDMSSFKKICRADITLDPSEFNTFYISKIATTEEYREKGLNSYLRKLVIEKAIVDPKIKSITGLVHENSPRFNLIKRIGYETIEVQLTDLNFSTPEGKVFFIKLHRQNFNSALKELELSDEITKLEEDFEIIIEIQQMMEL